jgi:hypothetical protein
MPKRWEIPEGLRVLPNGQWRVGEHDVVHPPTLRHLKAHLVVDDAGAFIDDGQRRMPIELSGPPFVAVALVVDAAQGSARVVLDDGSEEPVRDTSLGMDDATGRFECRVRKGRTSALLSRGAHQTLLEHTEEEGGHFFLRVGERRLPVRTS